MQVKTIPSDTLVALMAILSNYIEGLTPGYLVSALRAFEPEIVNGEKTALQKPMTKNEVLHLLGVSMPTLDRLMRSGKIRRINTGMKSVRIDRQSVIDYLKG